MKEDWSEKFVTLKIVADFDSKYKYQYGWVKNLLKDKNGNYTYDQADTLSDAEEFKYPLACEIAAALEKQNKGTRYILQQRADSVAGSNWNPLAGN